MRVNSKGGGQKVSISIRLGSPPLGRSKRTKLVSALGGFLLCLATSSAQATLISANDPFYGVNSITVDSTTGFEWLDLTQSTDFSINDIQGGAGGFQAHGFKVATLAQVEAMYTSGGWNGTDNSAGAGTAANLAFVQSIQSLFGLTGVDFNEGFALSSIAGLASRPFNALEASGTLGRVACTTSGFNTFTNVNVFTGCRMDFDQHYPFIGVFLVRNPAAVPEPTTLLLLGSGILGLAGLGRRRKTRS